MKTKWGSCNRETGHIWFNVELAKKHPDSLEYIAVHEMTHLLERGHGRRFTKLMDGFMPDWRAPPGSAQRGSVGRRGIGLRWGGGSPRSRIGTEGCPWDFVANFVPTPLNCATLFRATSL